MSSNPRLIASVPTALSYRNFVYSGLADRLASRTQLMVASTGAAQDSWRARGLPDSQFWELQAVASGRKHELIFSSLQQAFFSRYRVNTWDMINRYRHRDRATSFRQRLRQQLYRGLAPLARTGPGWRLLRKREEQAFHEAVPADVAARIEQAGISAGFSTVCKLAWEWPLFRTLQRLGIPTLTHILSFDNLTSVGFLPIQGFDRYLCWSQWLADQLVEFYEVPANRIEITGTPQFDFHLQPAFHWDRARLYSELQLDPARPYLLYCANLKIQTPREPELVRFLVQAFAADPALRDYQLVVRFHPSDDYSRWRELQRELGAAVRFCEPWGHAGDGNLHWGQVEVHSIALLSNSIRHASAVMSMGSTLALDCAVLDKPIVNLGFHPDSGCIEDRYYANAHQTFHYAPITKSDAAPVAGGLSELKEFMREALGNPGARSARRTALRNLICGPVDGHAAERIYAAVERLVGRPAPLAHT